MNRTTNKFHCDLRHPTKKEMDMGKKRTIESIEMSIKKHQSNRAVWQKLLEEIDTEIKLLQEELESIGKDIDKLAKKHSVKKKKKS